MQCTLLSVYAQYYTDRDVARDIGNSLLFLSDKLFSKPHQQCNLNALNHLLNIFLRCGGSNDKIAFITSFAQQLNPQWKYWTKFILIISVLSLRFRKKYKRLLKVGQYIVVRSYHWIFSLVGVGAITQCTASAYLLAIMTCIDHHTTELCRLWLLSDSRWSAI